jgi:PRTRC genetic system ParB family protein
LLTGKGARQFICQNILSLHFSYRRNIMQQLHSQYKDGSMHYLPLDAIEIEGNFNPRKFFEDSEFGELVSAVQSEGIIQPIVVRPNGDKLSVIAGERRFRAATKLRLTEVPAVVRIVDEKQAALMALMENASRSDLSITEEADSARLILSHCDNDREEAAKRLGWSRTKLDQRLALLHACDEVKSALTERKIKLGHVVLLCQLPDSMQKGTLEAILKDNISANDLKKRLSGFSLDLKTASFNTDACQSCPRNSAMQSSLFSDGLEAGQCADHECFAQKTESALLDKKQSLLETYAVVLLDTERDPSTYKEVCKTGSQGVGGEQFETGCKGCANFGAILSSKAGCAGTVTSDICFDVSCHKKKVELQQKANAPEPVATTQDSAPKSKGEKAVANAKKTMPPKKEKATSTTPKRVIGKIEAFFQQTAECVALEDINTSLAIAVYTLLEKNRQKEELLIESIRDKWSRTISRKNALPILHACTTDELKQMLVKAASHIPNLEEESFAGSDGLVAASKSILSMNKTNLTKRFRLDKDFLEAHTKGGIEIILREAASPSGQLFTETYEATNGKDSFKKLLKETHPDLVSKIFEFEFDFTGFVPSCLMKELDNNKNK